MRKSFRELLDAGWNAAKFVCVGLDPDVTKLPAEITGDPVDRIVEFNRMIIEATADIALAYKPQSAYYEALGVTGPLALRATIDIIRKIAPDVPVILDAKRADIGASNEAYVRTVFDFFDADAVTVHPYFGPEAMAPFLDRADRGVIVLCRTSNPGAGHYQDLDVGGKRLFEHIAQDVVDNWNYNGNCGLVIGATAPTELGDIRRIATELPFLIPGVGAQGGDVDATMKAGLDSRGHGLIISSSRGIIYAYKDRPDLSIEEATRSAAQDLATEIESCR